MRWEDDLPLSVTVQGTVSGQLSVIAHPPDYRGGNWMSVGGVGIAGEIGSSPEEVIALGEILGDPLTPDDRSALWEEHEQQREARTRALRQERMREGLEQRLSAQRPLSPRAEARLSSLALPEAFDDGCSLWQIQEAVASASGMHVVSDCFWQPRRDLREVVEVMYPEEQPEMAALLALRLSSLSTVAPERLRYWHPNDDRAGWEWGDAGSFLRFRHLARDLWRAAFLRETGLRELDGLLEPYVSGAVESADSHIAVEVTLDLRETSRIVCQLDDFQLYHGAQINYGDPFDKTEAYRQEMREEVLRATHVDEEPGGADLKAPRRVA